jgi:hypothetical protein
VKHVLLAIIAKQAERTLPHYLECIESLWYDKQDITIWIRSNNNTDDTAEILMEWTRTHHSEYRGIVEDYNTVPELVHKYKSHEWNPERFAVLGRIRQLSMSAAEYMDADYYFTADVDNYIAPHTLKDLVNVNLPIIAPLLPRKGYLYTNMHGAIDANGYWVASEQEGLIRERKIRGIFEVPVVHCTYLIRADALPHLNYLPDGTGRHEYVLFSESARKAGIPQYIDNRTDYGYLEIED